MSLQAAAITLRIDGHPIVEDAVFDIPEHSVIALVGPNGAGKSTLLRLLACTQTADSGEVFFDGSKLRTMSRRDRARRVALVEQDTRSEFALTVRQTVQLGRIPFQSIWTGLGEEDQAVVSRALVKAGVAEFADRQFATLSGGEQQRVHLARALAQEPRLMLLDEPTNHLDIHAQLRTLGLLRSLAMDGVTVFAALHDLNLAAAYCDYVVVMKEARVHAVGTVEQIVRPDLIEEVYGVAADVVRHPRTGKPLIAFSENRTKDST